MLIFQPKMPTERRVVAKQYELEALARHVHGSQSLRLSTAIGAYRWRMVHVLLVSVGSALEFFGVLLALKTLLYVADRYGPLPATLLRRTAVKVGRWARRRLYRLLGIRTSATVFVQAASASGSAMGATVTTGPGTVDASKPVADQLRQLTETVRRLANELRAELKAERDGLRKELAAVRTEAADRHSALAEEVKGLATQTFHSRAWGVVMILAGTAVLAVSAT